MEVLATQDLMSDKYITVGRRPLDAGTFRQKRKDWVPWRRPPWKSYQSLTSENINVDFDIYNLATTIPNMKFLSHNPNRHTNSTKTLPSRIRGRQQLKDTPIRRSRLSRNIFVHELRSIHCYRTA